MSRTYGREEKKTPLQKRNIFNTLKIKMRIRLAKIQARIMVLNTTVDDANSMKVLLLSFNWYNTNNMTTGMTSPTTMPQTVLSAENFNCSNLLITNAPNIY
jgi:hypothetical protein